MDTAWALSELHGFVEVTALVSPPPSNSGIVFIGDDRYPRGSRADITAKAQVVEQIIDRVLPGWRASVEDPEPKKKRWQHHRQAAIRAIAQLEREAELREKLGDNAPVIGASRLHPWVWDGARSLWQSGHRAEAVRAAATKINAETQNRVGRRDVSEADLIAQCYSAEAPQPGKPRLRLPDDDGGKTAASRRVGVIQLANGLFSLLRNPLSHEPTSELEEDVALEQLAALSVLARAIDASEVDTA